MSDTPISITSEIQKLSPSSVVELFELDTTIYGGDVYYFHAGTNQLNQNIVWQGQQYSKFPISVTGFERTGVGQLPRPTIAVSNYLSVISVLLLQYSDLIGCKFTRRRTLVKYLDAVNFSSGVNLLADPTASFPDDIYYVDQKKSENREGVSFELASAIDLAGVLLPKRQVIQNLCPWLYRGPDCGYVGTSYFDQGDAPATQENDVCGKRVSSCKCRFGSSAELPFGGFPGADLYK